jgi:hypothetical protein
MKSSITEIKNVIEKLSNRMEELENIEENWII